MQRWRQHARLLQGSRGRVLLSVGLSLLQSLLLLGRAPAKLSAAARSRR